MCRGENVQCKECSQLSSRIVQICIRGEMMVNCPEIVIEGVNPEKEECHLCRCGGGKGKFGGHPRSKSCPSQFVGSKP
ncbi:hypothetical protein NXS19_003723 [Fusarium pseudograminearum]|nr:hypothetical protein NXS19_003723 [Fusarium pseudograminearum]